MDNYLVITIVIVILLMVYSLSRIIGFTLKKSELKEFNTIHKIYIDNFSSEKFEKLDYEGKVTYYQLARSMLTLVDSTDIVNNVEIKQKLVDVYLVIIYIESKLNDKKSETHK